MSSNKHSFLKALGLAAVLGLGASGAAHAGGADVYWSVGVSQPGLQVGVGNFPAYPVVYPSYPVVVAPQPIYVPPRVVYVPPPPVYRVPPPGWRYEHRGYEPRGWGRGWDHDGRGGPQGHPGGPMPQGHGGGGRIGGPALNMGR